MRDWEQHYFEGIIPWDKGAPAPPLEDWLSRNAGSVTGEVLVPGCGLGHDVRLLAEKTEASVSGLDLSPTAIAQAEEVAKAADEVYVEGDLFDLPRELKKRFPWVWEHTCFCAIQPEQRDDYVLAIHESLAEGGHLLGVFYLNPYDDEHQPGEDPPHGCSEDELRQRFVESGKFEWRESAVPERSYPSRQGKELLVLMRKSGVPG